jgi:hypothetical protein
MALDHPEAVMSLSVMDIVPTYAVLKDANRLSRVLTGIGISCRSLSRFQSG